MACHQLLPVIGAPRVVTVNSFRRAHRRSLRRSTASSLKFAGGRRIKIVWRWPGTVPLARHVMPPAGWFLKLDVNALGLGETRSSTLLACPGNDPGGHRSPRRLLGIDQRHIVRVDRSYRATVSSSPFPPGHQSYLFKAYLT